MRSPPTDPPTVRPRLVTAVILCGTVVGPLNSTMIAVALPRMAGDFGVSTDAMSWLVTSYLIATATLQPVAGKLGDRFGRRPILLTGFALFLIACALAMIAPNLPLLIICRVIQGAAGSLVSPNAMALIRAVAPPDRVGQTFGLLGAVLPLAAAVGPILGGGLLVLGSWQAIFAVNLPFTTAALVLGWWVIPRRTERSRTARFDGIGAVWLCAVLVGGTVLLDRGPHGAASAVAWMLVAGFTTGFVSYEARHRDPVIQPKLFTQRSFAASAAGIALSNMAFYVTLLAVPQLLHRRGLGELGIGLVVGALTVASSPIALLGGRMADRIGPRLPAMLGVTITAAGLIALSFGANNWPLLGLAALLAVLGSGIGLSMTPFQVGALHKVAGADTGVATGVFFASRYLGSIVGSSLLAGPLAPTRPGGFPLLFGVLAAITGLAVASSALLPGRPHRVPEPTTDR